MSVDHEALERRYLRLLRWYPATYRRTRGSEILDTLMESAEPGQRRPTGRERRALLLGGLRARTGADRTRSRSELWLGGARLGASLLLVHAAAGALTESVRMVGDLASGRLLLVGGRLLEVLHGSERVPLSFEWGYPLTLLLAAGALVLLAAGRPVPALALAVGGVAAQLWAYSWSVPGMVPWGLTSAHMWPLPLAAALLVLLAWRRPAAAPRPWRWLLAVPVGVLVLPTSFDASFPSDQLFVLVLLGALVWSVVDARVPVALSAVLLAYAGADLAAGVLQFGGNLFVGPPVAIPLTSMTVSPLTLDLLPELTVTALLLGAAAWRAAHQARV